MTDQTPNHITDSRFNMWRAVFAMAHADDIITDEEEKFMRDAISEYPFSEDQKAVLELDITQKANVGECFHSITDQHDKSEFFIFARLLVWSDGDFDAQERNIMDELKKVHMSALDFQTMLKDVQLSFDDEEKDQMRERTRTMYRNLQEEKETSGSSVFGGVVRQMWKSEESKMEYEKEQRELERVAKEKEIAEREARKQDNSQSE